MAKEFVGHLTFNFSNDGLVYCGRPRRQPHPRHRQAGQLQAGIHARAVHRALAAPTGGVMFSTDKEQSYLYISDLTNNHVWFLNRADGKVVGTLGQHG